MRHYVRFMEQSRDFDQRLGTVLNQAFQDSKNLHSAFKVGAFTENSSYMKSVLGRPERLMLAFKIPPRGRALPGVHRKRA